VIGYKYGATGANFNVPDFRGKVARGTGTPTPTPSIGVVGGSDNINMAIPNLPSHTYGISFNSGAAGRHNHNVSGSTGGQSANHTHTYSGTTSFPDRDHRHGANLAGSSYLHRLGSYSGAQLGLIDGGAGTNVAVGYTS